jgi:UDP:flavonoid glycosyltransferase YjiC (YdhE family)
MKVLVLLSAAGGGDRQPVIGLAVALDARGHDVAFLCDAATGALVAGTGIRTLIHDVEQVGYISGWIKRLADDDHPPNPFLEWGSLALDAVGDSVADLSPDVIVSSLFCMGLADLMASAQGVPWCFVNPSFYFGKGSKTTWDDDWFGPFVPRLARECFAPLVDRADLVIHATDPMFDFEPIHLPASHHYVGFVLWEPSMETPGFLAEPGNAWALVSASTARPGDEATMLRAAVHGLAEHPVRVVLTAPKGGITDDITAAASVVGHVPHSLILQRSAISVNQASAGIVSKCLTYGVPMVLLPWDADQPGGAARAEALGVATSVPKDTVTPDAVSRAVDRILSEPDFQSRASDVAATLSTRSPARAAALLVEQL